MNEGSPLDSVREWISSSEPKGELILGSPSRDADELDDVTGSNGGADPSVPSDARPRGRRRKARDRNRREVVATVMVVVAVLAIVGFLIALAVRSSGTSKTSQATGAAGNIPARGPNTAVYDRFDRADSSNSLGNAETGQQWLTGDVPWSISGKVAQLQRGDPPHFVLAVVKAGSPDGSVQATIPKISNGAGVVFRYRNAFNYWEVVASPSFSTWNVRKVVGGKVTLIGNVGVAAAVDGTTIGVTYVDTRITVQVNGKDVWATLDSDVDDGEFIGLIGLSDGAARWDNFVGNITARTLATPPPAPPPAQSSPGPFPN